VRVTDFNSDHGQQHRAPPQRTTFCAPAPQRASCCELALQLASAATPCALSSITRRACCAGSGKLAGVIGLRVWHIKGEVPSALSRQHGALPLPLAGRSLPGCQVQLTVMQTYRITMQSVLRASGCVPVLRLCGALCCCASLWLAAASCSWRHRTLACAGSTLGCPSRAPARPRTRSLTAGATRASSTRTSRGRGCWGTSSSSTESRPRPCTSAGCSGTCRRTSGRCCRKHSSSCATSSTFCVGCTSMASSARSWMRCSWMCALA
jgi:hypothetical protein